MFTPRGSISGFELTLIVALLWSAVLIPVSSMAGGLLLYEVGITVPQQVMASIFHQVTPKWAVLGSVGWQDWSEFGQVQLGIDDTNNPTSTTKDLDFDDTWHAALGAQYRINDPWLLNFGIAYDSKFQDNSDVSPPFCNPSQRRFWPG